MPAASVDRRFCVAPMMRYSHVHARHLWRRLCPSALLYTEMLTANAVIHGDQRRLLARPKGQSPVALQLGGSEAESLATAAKIGEEAGYAEINLNCGCPSNRVRNGGFGACLMKEPRRTGELVATMKRSVGIPVTVKCRLAVDEGDEEEGLDLFVGVMREAGADAVIVHARRAWLDGLNPAQNRSVPPINHERVRRLAERFSDLPIVLNGNLHSLSDVHGQLPAVGGVMLGRAICRTPWLLAQVSESLFNQPVAPRLEIAAEMLDYVRLLPAREWRRALAALAALFHGVANGKFVRQRLALASPAKLTGLAGEWRRQSFSC